VRYVCLALNAYTLVIFARIILEWVPVGYEHPVARVRAVLRAVTEPVLGPVRRMMPPLRTGSMALDLSPIVVILTIQVITWILCRP
jgi:YggT family protein